MSRIAELGFPAQKALLKAIDMRTALRGCEKGGPERTPRSRIIAFVLLLGFSALGATSGASIPQDPAIVMAPADRPFQPGEKMVFQIKWNPPWYLFFLPSMEAGTADISISGALDYENRKAVKIVFAARSSGTFARLAGFKIDHHYEIFADPEGFCSYAVSKREREKDKKRDIEIIYLKESRRLHIKETDVSVTPAVVKKDKYVEDVPECVQDYLAAIYFLRMKGIEPGSVIRSVVGENETVKDLEAHAEKRERVDTLTGRYDTWRVDIKALKGALFRGGGQFKVWMTANEQKVPVQFEVKTSVGKVTGKLLKYSPNSEAADSGAGRKPNSVSPRQSRN